MIEPRTGTRIWLAAGVTDLRRGFDGLSAQVQTVLEQQPFSGHVFVFRGRRGDMVKLLWFDGDGLCLFAKRLEKGRFVWPPIVDDADAGAIGAADRGDGLAQNNSTAAAGAANAGLTRQRFASDADT